MQIIRSILMHVCPLLWLYPRLVICPCDHHCDGKVLAGTLAVFKSKYYYTDNDDLVLADDGGWALTDKVSAQIRPARLYVLSFRALCGEGLEREGSQWVGRRLTWRPQWAS